MDIGNDFKEFGSNYTLFVGRQTCTPEVIPAFKPFAASSFAWPVAINASLKQHPRE
jgi:hypothetical protein